MFPKQIFITGTDTGVGKSVISAIITAGLNAKYWKPIQCGLEEPTDTEAVQLMTGLGQENFCQECYRLAAPLSPHASADLENSVIDLDNLTIPVEARTSPLVVEGAGGIMVPLNEKEYMIDLMKKLDLPVVLVARSGLGTINHTLLSLQTLRLSSVDVLGVVMNGSCNRGNKEAIERHGKVDILAEIEPVEDTNRMDCNRLFSENFKCW